MRWTTDKTKQLDSLYPDMPNDEIAEILGCTESAVKNRAVKRGLKKSAEFIETYSGGKPVRWVCEPCGKRHGVRVPQLATWHHGTCDSCRIQQPVTSARKYGVVGRS